MESDNRQGNLLLIRHGALPTPECPGLLSDEHTFGLSLSIVQGDRQAPGCAQRLLECSSATLPFQDCVFRTVILYLVTHDGKELELDEACRVLAHGGELLILGRNRSSWSGLRGFRAGPVPQMNVASVRHQLQAHDMVLDGTLGAGLLGQTKPMMEWNRLSGLALPVADLVMLRARHRERPVATRLRMRKISAGVVPTAFLNG